MLASFTANPLAARAVWDTAQLYRELKKYEKANRLYKYVVTNWPNAEHALWAQADLIKSYLAVGDDPNAEAAVEGLLADFSDNPLIARAVWDTAQHYRELKKYEKASRLYQHVATNWPNAEHALWAQADLIKSYLALGDDPNAQAAVDKLLVDFTANPLIPRAIHDTAYEYRKLEKYDRADQLDQFVIDNWPRDEQAMWAKMDIAKTDILLGNDAAVEPAIDTLIADFNHHPDLPQALFRIGEGYYEPAFAAENKGDLSQSKDLFRKAIAIWERIINELPRSSMTPQAYYFAARCYDTLGELDYAANYYQTVIDDWPDYKFCDVAHFLFARCFEKLANSGNIPREEAALMIRATCEKLLADYPDSRIVKATTNLLEQSKSVKAP